MDILIVTETFEVLKSFIGKLELKENFGNNYARFSYKNRTVDILISGFGAHAINFALTKALTMNNYDLVLHFGQCFSLKGSVENNQLVCIIDDYFGDLGYGTMGNFASLFDLEISNKNEPPFKNEILENNNSLPDLFSDVRKVSGITCNCIPESISDIANAYIKNYPDVISREGANAHYICARENTQLVQLCFVHDTIENVQANQLPNQKMIDLVQERVEAILGDDDFMNS